MISLFKNKKPVEAIRKFKSSKDLLITYEELEKIPLNVMTQMVSERSGAIESTRISSNNPDTLMFTITMKEGELWDTHHHDCFETCVLFKGELYDYRSSTSGKVIGAAGILTFKPFVPHKVIALKDSIFYVEFKNPKTQNNGLNKHNQ